ncbi:MAG: response regulator transcription factor [Bryobacterales bacterium]|nr:response regulator transcription factor [Bryobacterales bacterium]
MPSDVLLVEDHRIVRDGVRAMLERADDFRVVGEVESGAEAVQFCRRQPPDVVVMDLSLPDLNGMAATEEILRTAPNTKIVILSMHEDDKSVIGAIRAGARGFVLKKASLGDLIDALRAVAKGGSYLSPQVSDKLLSRIQRGDMETTKVPDTLDVLSPRELQVLRMVAEGKTSKDIAIVLNLGLQTVRSYRKTMMKKLGVNNVAGLTHLAMSAGLTPQAAPPLRETAVAE